jgi:hypothetical protein
MNTYIPLGLAAALLGCTCLYLASHNQRWLASPWPARPARAGAAMLLVLGWILLAQYMQLLTATFTFLAVVMLALSTLPYIGALLTSRRNR